MEEEEDGVLAAYGIVIRFHIFGKLRRGLRPNGIDSETIQPFDTLPNCTLVLIYKLIVESWKEEVNSSSTKFLRILSKMERKVTSFPSDKSQMK